jgi:hypothetical protein
MTSGGTIAEEEEKEKARESLRRDLRRLVKPDFIVMTTKENIDVPSYPIDSYTLPLNGGMGGGMGGMGGGVPPHGHGKV